MHHFSSSSSSFLAVLLVAATALCSSAVFAHARPVSEPLEPGLDRRVGLGEACTGAEEHEAGRPVRCFDGLRCKLVDPFLPLGISICVPVDQPAKFREYCGDDVYHVQCEQGLHCDHSNQREFDHAGVCLPDSGSPPFAPPASGFGVAQEGQMCGGFAGISCASHLECRFDPHDKVVSDKAGICAVKKTPGSGGNPSKLAAFGQRCGGFVGIGCQKGLVCKHSGVGNDRFGVCDHIPAPPPPSTGSESRQLAEFGEACGGFVGVQCVEGLLCKLHEIDVADSQGICAKP